MSHPTVYEAPIQPVPTTDPQIFLAGGITGCPDWQAEAIAAFSELGAAVTLYNPRRALFPIHDPTAAEDQITWEYRMLTAADAVLFWFPADTLCPIVLYELGAQSKTNKVLFVGTDPAYARRTDVVVQLRLARPEVVVRDSLSAVLCDAGEWVVRRAPAIPSRRQ